MYPASKQTQNIQRPNCIPQVTFPLLLGTEKRDRQKVCFWIMFYITLLPFQFLSFYLHL